MTTKLTLSVDPEVIEKGKRIAARNNTSLSQMVQNYLLLLDEDEGISKIMPIPKKLQMLIGIGSGDATIDDYREHAERKHS